MANTGRPRKPDAQKRLEGNPGGRPLGGELTAAGKPPMPKGLDKAGKDLWNLVQQEWVGEIDGPELQTLCETWSMLRKVARLAKRDPNDTTTRTNYLAYVNVFDKLAAKFGMTPSDRAKIRLPVDQEKDTDEKTYFGLTG